MSHSEIEKDWLLFPCCVSEKYDMYSLREEYRNNNHNHDHE